jgi:transposase
MTTYLYEEEKLGWAKNFIDLLLEIKEKVDKSQTGKLSKKLIDEYEDKYDKLIKIGYKQTPKMNHPTEKKRGRKKRGKALCLLDRFKKYKNMVLGFMKNPIIPFDNNQAERDIRMAKLYQKISGCFRTFNGSKDFLLIRSFLSTARKNGLNLIDSIKKIIQNQEIEAIFG